MITASTAIAALYPGLYHCGYTYIIKINAAVKYKESGSALSVLAIFNMVRRSLLPLSDLLHRRVVRLLCSWS